MNLLIEAEALSALLHKSNVRLLDVRFNLSLPVFGSDLYKQEHIPGAVYANLDTDLSGTSENNSKGRRPLPEASVFLEKIRGWGIEDSTHTIIYDDGEHSIAARAWWLFRWMGITRVSVLHGGIKKWQALRYPMSTRIPKIKKSNIILKGGLMPVINVDGIVDSIGSNQLRLIDSRSEKRFNGLGSIYARAGHIPGALSHHFVKNTDDDGYFLSPEKMKTMYTTLIDGHSKPVFYCGSGVTACNNIMAMEYAGLGVSTLYPGSWSEWVADPNRPVEIESVT